MTIGSLLLILLAVWVLTNTLFPTLFSLLAALVIWALTGWLAGKVSGGRFSTLGYIGLGWVGGLIGVTVFRFIGLGFIRAYPFGGIIVGVAGALIFIYLVRWLFDSNFAR